LEKIWLKHYPKDVPAEINPDRYQSLIQIFEETCWSFPDRPAFYNMGTTLNFSEVESYSRAMAAYFQQALKLSKGDRVAIMLPNVLQYPIVFFGAIRAGLIVVNVNPLYTAPELVHQLRDSGAETIIVLENFAKTVQDAMTHTALKNVIVTEMGDFFPPMKATFIHFYLKYLKRKIPPYFIKKMETFKSALSRGKTLTLQPVEVRSEDLALLQYTGGTTGVSKGAMLTHRNLVSNILQADAWLQSIFKHGKEIVITALPLYHIFSLTANGLLLFKEGGLNVLITNPRDLKQTISSMAKFEFTSITGVNTLFNALSKQRKFKKLNFKKLKLSLGGGMAVQQAVAERWKTMTGCVLLEAYGLTETSPAVTINPPDLQDYNGTVGLPIPSTNICIFDDDGHELSVNQPGELAVKGPQVMLGYWNNPAETEKVFTKDGWLLTGDIALINPEGFVRILERKKDMILVSGFNVYPNEIEDILMQIPGVHEAAVIGVPDERSGEAVKAFIVKNDPNLTIHDVIEGCRKMLTGYKLPKHVEFRTELPKTNVGKILRRALKNPV